MTANPFFPLDEMSTESDHTEMMVFPQVDQSIYERRRQMVDTVVDYKEMRMRYSCAIKEVRTKFDVLNSEFNVRYQRNPITSISSRLKSSSSIMRKLDGKNLSFTLENVENNLFDVAGIRVVCSYVDDIYMLAEALAKQDDITVLKEKDYIKHPKPNGYRSYHMIVSVPVFFSDRTKNMAVEVQIRTIAMDFWASLEHQLKYKQEVPNQVEIVRQLSECAEQIASVDRQMWRLREQIEKSEDIPTEEEILLEKLSRIDIAINE
jgi:putative GTP pyrophosphokinase